MFIRNDKALNEKTEKQSKFRQDQCQQHFSPWWANKIPEDISITSDYNVPIDHTVVHIKIWWSVLLYAVKTVEGDFWFWDSGRPYKKIPTRVRIVFICFLVNDVIYNNIYKQYRTDYTYILHIIQFTLPHRRQS